MNPSRPFFSVVILAHNEEESISRFLRSMASLNYPSERYEVVVVNNNSTDKTRELVSRDFPMVRLIDEPRPGVVFARIRGAAEAQGEIIACTDADCTVPADWLAKIADAYNDSSVVAVGGTVQYNERSFISLIQRLALLVHHQVYYLMTGTNMSFRMSAYCQCGGFAQGVNFGEDSLISQQLKKVGRLVILHGNPVATSLRRQQSRDGLIYMIKAILFYFTLLVLHRPLRLNLKPASAHKTLKTTTSKQRINRFEDPS